MDFSVISDNLSYLLLGAYPDGPLGGAALTLLLASLSGLASAVLGLVLGVALAVLPGKPRLLLVALLGFFRAIPVLMLIFWTYSVSYTHLRAHETGRNLVCRLLLEKKKPAAHQKACPLAHDHEIKTLRQIDDTEDDLRVSKEDQKT